MPLYGLSRARLRLAIGATAACLAAFGVGFPAAARAEPPAAPAATVADLQKEIAALRSEYEKRIAELETRLAALEASRRGAPSAAPPAPAQDELAQLRAAAQAAAGGAEATAPTPPPTAPAFGHERNLNRLNPEISFTGILQGHASNRGREEFTAREFELDLQSALDPFSRSRLTLSFAPGQGVAVEEGWVNYNALPGGLQLIAGKFRQRFGALNRQHLHALPQVDYPLVLQRDFGDEGLDQTGVSLDWTVPHPWASANELTLEVTDGENPIFGGASFRHLAVLGHLKNYWDLSSAAYLEWGLSGVTGEAPTGGANRVFGTDVTYHWQPLSRAKYRELTWRSEVLLSQRRDPLGLRRDAWGGYSYVEALARQNLYLGLRVDRVEDPLDPALRTWGLVPYFTWWESEFVRLRAELRHLTGDLVDAPDNELFLQLTWAAGPHKHETY